MKAPRKGGAMGITNFLSINKSPDERDGMAGTICVWGAQMWVERATQIAMNTVQMNGSEIYRSFLGTNDDVSIFLQETSTTESSHKNGILISSQLPAPIATSLVIDGLLTQSSAFSPFQLITAILWPFIHLEKGWQWTWLGICCCWLLWWWWWWWWLRNVGNLFFFIFYFHFHTALCGWWRVVR